MTNLDDILKEIHLKQSRGKYTNTSKDLPHSYYVYGESNYVAVEAIVNRFKDYFNESCVFYDLGSGTGKIPIHIGLKYNIKKSIGIEISPQRCSFLEDIKLEYPNLEYSNISILNESFLESDLKDATVVYFDNTMYTDPIYESKAYSKIPIGCLIISRKDIFDRGEKVMGREFLTSYNKESILYHIKNSEIQQEEIDKKIKLRNSIIK